MAIPIVSEQDMQELIQSHDKFHADIKNHERDGLDKLRAGIIDIKGLRCPLSDSFLIRFLRTKNYNVPKSVKLVEQYFKLKHDEDHLQLIPSSTYLQIYGNNIINVLKNRDNHNRQIIHVRLDLVDFSKLTMDELLMAGYFLLEEMTLSEVTQNHGVVIIFDHCNMSMARATTLASNLSMKHINKALKVFHGAFPCKIKLLACINVNMILNSAYNVIKYFLSDKMKKRVFSTKSGPEVLHEYINPEILPKVLGGPLTCEEAIDSSVIKGLVSCEKYYRGLQTLYGYSKNSKSKDDY